MSNWALFGKYLSGNSTADENEWLEEQLIVDAKLRSDFENAKIIWGASAIDFIEIPDPEKEWTRFRSRIEAMESDPDVALTKKLVWAVPLAASLLAVAFFLGLVISGQQNQSMDVVASTAGAKPGKMSWEYAKNENQFFEIITTSSQKSIYLPDSTHVMMSPGSSIRYTSGFGEQSRVVMLDGEAFFDVTRDTSRTFEILSGNARTTVLGTSFNLRAYTEEDSITLLVTSGLVDFNANSDFNASLKKDDYMAYYKGSRRYAVRNTAKQPPLLKNTEPLVAKNSKKTRINIKDSLSLVYTYNDKLRRIVFRPTIYNASENYSAGNIRIEVTAYDKEQRVTGTVIFPLTEDIKPTDSLVVKRKIRFSRFTAVDSLSAKIIEASETSVYEKRDE
ncbi:MAG: FecR family protein [Cyclobacteriaceae bacterium]